MTDKTSANSNRPARLSVLTGALAVLATLAAPPAYADSLYGTCAFDGQPVDNIMISTDFGDQRAFSKGGKYSLDFGAAVGRTVTVFVNGRKHGPVEVNGEIRFDIKLPPASPAAVYGTCYVKGQPADKATEIITSWDKRRAFVRNGEYRIDFSKNVPKGPIFIIVNGKEYKQIDVKGETRFDISLP